MRKKCFVAVLALHVLVLSQVISVCASEAQPLKSSTTSTITSELPADDTIVKSGVIVQLPADLDLTYSDSFDMFQVKTKVGVYGDISDYMEVKISMPSELEYTNDDESSLVTGFVTFGNKDDTESYEIWSAAEVYAGEEDSDSIDRRNLAINVPAYNISNVDDYSSDVKFNIALEAIGSVEDICAPTANSYKIGTTYYYIYNNKSLSSSYVFQPYIGNMTVYSGDSINLNGIVTSNRNTSFEASYSDNDYIEKYANIKYIQMSSIYKSSPSSYYSYSTTYDTSMFYASDASGKDFGTLVRECKSWAFIYKNLQVLVVPGDMQTNQLQCSNALYFETTLFPDTNIEVGNALVFAKDINELDQFIYVPHIVYRGTTEEWKALSGRDDWTFGNIGNIVTVHCTDGVLCYY
jgi:hypothetical protein